MDNNFENRLTSNVRICGLPIRKMLLRLLKKNRIPILQTGNKIYTTNSSNIVGWAAAGDVVITIIKFNFANVYNIKREVPVSNFIIHRQIPITNIPFPTYIEKF